MKKFILLLSLVFSFSAIADCTISIKKPRDSSMRTNYISNRTYNQILEIMKKKGYLVLSNEEQRAEAPDYKLDIIGSFGYGCGTGLTFTDYLSIPAYNSIDFTGISGVNEHFEESFSAPVGVKIIAKRHLMKVVKSLPQCIPN